MSQRDPNAPAPPEVTERKRRLIERLQREGRNFITVGKPGTWRWKVIEVRKGT